MVRIGKSIWNRFLRLLLRPKRLAIFEACLIGLVSGLAALLLAQSVGWLGGWRQQATHLIPAYLALPLIGAIGGFLSGLIVDRLAPAASGSGMTEVKAVLANVPMPLNLRIALVKLVSATLVLAAGMPLGREGPTVQIGAALASQLSRWFPTSPDHRRQILAAGAGAGLAAAFNAPIAGVLFVVEELLQDVSGITLGTAILASFIASVVARISGSHNLDLDLHLVVSNTSFSAPEIPFYLLLGILAGGLGVLFNRSILTSLALYRRLNVSLPWRVGLAGLMTGVAFAALPDLFRDNAGLRELLLTGNADWQLVAIVFCVQFFLIVATYGSGAPGGLLIPSMVLGAALGYLVGVGEHQILGLSLATTYARVGMAAFFCAVARTPITAVIIVFEMTTDFNLVLPLMIVSVTSYLIAELFEEGSLYDDLLEFKGIHLTKETTAQDPWTDLTASDVMQPRVETLSSQMRIEEALQAFSQSSHRTFPIVESGKLVGILTQKDIANLSVRGLNGENLVSDLMTPDPVRIDPEDTLAYVLHLLDRHDLSSLPVVEGRRLVGIITRSDIIRVEAACLNNESLTEPKAERSRMIYQTRSPETGQGRILVPLSNPKTSLTLLEMAVAIARDRNYEIECLQVIVVPKHHALAETPVKTAEGQKLLKQASRLSQAWRVPIHTQIRVAHDLSGALLETLKERHIDLVLMGWKGSTTTPGRVFSRVVDTMIRQAACEVVLVKLSDSFGSAQSVNRLERWLVPMAGGPNAQGAVRLLPALMSLSKTVQVRLFHVYKASEQRKTDNAGSEPTEAVLTAAARFLKPQVNASILTTSVCADSVPAAVLNYAKQDQSDVIVLGASREGLLQQVQQGNIPAVISRQSNCTVILVRAS
ncbi:MAG: chloride channel protein [Phormidesmis sp. CAN_BIN44]|nr:chloride channel protein [Phormidesmis sp. CAN_BIN44]